MSDAFRLSLPLRFAHCDAAGIGYYPSYFELCDAAVEDWTEWALGASRRHMHLDLGLGLPTVDLKASFERPGRLGDPLDLDVTVRRVGRSSIDLQVDVSRRGEKLFGVNLIQVLTRLETMRAEPWPAQWRERLTGLAKKESST